ncbi:MAG: hypothetical protein Q9214_001531, partial [Letrouitia sp. 1 TL-2023]
MYGRETRRMLLLCRLFQDFIATGRPKFEFETRPGEQVSLKDMFDNRACEPIRDYELVEDKSLLSCNSDFECLGGNVNTEPPMPSQPLGSQDGHNSTASANATECPESSVKTEDGGTIDTFDILQSDPGSEPMRMATNNSVSCQRLNATRGKRAIPPKRVGPRDKSRRVKSSSNCTFIETDRTSDQQSVQRRSSHRLRRPTRLWNRASTEALREVDPAIDGPDEAGERFATVQQESLLVVKSKKLQVQDEGRLLVHPEQEDIPNSVSVTTVTMPEGVTTARSTVTNLDVVDRGQGCSPPYVQHSTQKISVSGRGVVRGLNPFELNSKESPIRFYVIDERGSKHRWLHNNPKLILESIQTMYEEISACDIVNSDDLERLESKLITSQERIITFESIVYRLEKDTSHDIFEDMK